VLRHVANEIIGNIVLKLQQIYAE